ncbi:MAG: DNA glycosylase [Candidatus Aenigmatarchaeota archaeon]
MLIDLRLTMESGQTPEFVWDKNGYRYSRIVDGRTCELWQDKQILCTNGFENYVSGFLRETDDLKIIYKKIDTDSVMNEAIEKYNGLRITKSNPWETTVSFICSANNNIKRIRKNVQSLMINGVVMTPAEILKTDLNYAKLGFREKFLKKSSEMIVGGHSLEEIKKMKYDEAVEHLMKLHGVGNKVANCILLFGYGFLEAFPVDTWISKAMTKIYFGGKKASVDKIQSFAQDRWGKYAGYANQYLFCYARQLKTDAP